MNTRLTIQSILVNIRAKRVWQFTKVPRGIRCARCKHKRFRWMAYCPKCMDAALRELDTSAKDESGR